MVEVVATRINERSFPENGKEKLLTQLPDTAIKRILQYTRHIDFSRTLAGELLVRSIISDKLHIPFHSIIFKFSSKGRPAIDSKHSLFSIFHIQESL